jgi:pentatricopeptide repeat protein
MNLIRVYCEVKEFEKAKKVMTRAIAEFQGTLEEVRVKKGLAMLKKI